MGFEGFLLKVCEAALDNVTIAIWGMVILSEGFLSETRKMSASTQQKMSRYSYLSLSTLPFYSMTIDERISFAFRYTFVVG